jgi:hypothetical protein
MITPRRPAMESSATASARLLVAFDQDRETAFAGGRIGRAATLNR